MKRFSLYFILVIFSSLLVTSCEKDDDDSRFVRIGEVRATVNGEQFISRDASVEFRRYEFDKYIPFSAIIFCENVQGDRMTFHIGKATPGDHLLSEIVDPNAGLNEYYAVTYKESAENGGDEFSSKMVVPNPNNQISPDVPIPFDVRSDESLIYAYSGGFSYSAGNETEGIVNVEDGTFEIILTKDESDSYFKLLDEYSTYVELLPDDE